MQILKNKKLACAAIVLALLISTGIAYAAYTFLTAKTEITIDEVIVISLKEDDDLQPYMYDGVNIVPDITLSDITPNSITITITSDGDATELCPGEKLVIPVNVRSKSRGATPIPVTVSISGTPGLNWYWAYETNTAGSSDFKPSLGWHDFPAAFDATGGAFGSAEAGAEVFFVYIGVPMDAAPGTYTVYVTFSRG